VEDVTATPVPAPTPEPQATPVPPETWAAAIATVEERRGSTGRIDVPVELQHYSDNRRFLALQMADSKEEGFDLPHDQAELVEMIKLGELVEMKALGDDYILYDVGTASREDPLAHYDPSSGKDVKLFASFADYAAYDTVLAQEERRRDRRASGPGPSASCYRPSTATPTVARRSSRSTGPSPTWPTTSGVCPTTSTTPRTGRASRSGC
jgi:hypothetical protein